MALALACLSIVLAYFSPAELLPSLAPFRVQLVILLFGVATALVTISMRPIRGMQSPQYLLILGLWAAIIASHVLSLKLRWAFDAVFLFGPLVAIYFLVQLTASSLRRIRLFAFILIACAVIQGAEAILAYYTGFLAESLLLLPPGSPMAVFGNRVRGFGFLSDPNDFGQFLLVGLSLLGIFWKKGRTPRNLALLGPPALVLILATYLTFSRGAMLGMGAVFFFAISRKGARLPAVAITALAVLIMQALNFTGGRAIAIDGTTAGRLVAWGAGITATARHPLFGIGYGRFQDINDITAHNSFVLCFTELGLFGYFFWMALLIVSVAGLTLLTRLPLKTSEEEAANGAAHALRAAFFAFLVTAWFLSRTYTETLYILLALAASLIQLRVHLLPEGFTRPRRLVPQTLACEFASMMLVYIFVRARLI